MSLKPTPVGPVPELTAFVANAAFPDGTPYMAVRDALGTFYDDEHFAGLFPSRGRPAEAPWRLALVTVLQFAEGLADRQAADAVRGRIDWKYALGLELTDPGFDFPVLCEFCARLIDGGAERLLLEAMLETCKGHGLVKARGKQRTDSTHVLAAIRTLNRLELAAEALPPKPPMTDLSALLEQLGRLGLDFAAEALPDLLGRAVKEDLGPPALLGRLLAGELERREERRVRTSLRLSGLPAGQTLANFDFAFQPAVERSKLEALATCGWLREKQALLILGPPGVGKTHLAVSLGVCAVECGFSVAFFRLGELLHAMRQDAEVPPTRLKGKKYMKAGLVIIDEVGFETFTREEANPFFRLVSYRYQRGSLCITSNKAIKTEVDPIV
jgi:DNA replication protein DnaC/transposase